MKPQISTAEILAETKRLEDEKAEKARLRAEKKQRKERQRTMSLLEKLVAPILLAVTVVVSLLLMR